MVLASALEHYLAWRLRLRRLDEKANAFTVDLSGSNPLGAASRERLAAVCSNRPGVRLVGLEPVRVTRGLRGGAG